MKVFTEDELKRFFSKVKFTSSPERYDLLFSMMLQFGMRIGEVRKVLLEDIDLAKRTIRIQGLKNGRERTYHLSDDLTTRMKRHLRKTDSEHLFPNRFGNPLSSVSIWKAFRFICELADIEGKTPHSFRHTAGTTIAFVPGKGIADVANLLRHRSIQSAEKYIALRDNFKEDLEMASIFERMKKGK